MFIDSVCVLLLIKQLKQGRFFYLFGETILLNIELAVIKLAVTIIKETYISIVYRLKKKGKKAFSESFLKYILRGLK